MSARRPNPDPKPAPSLLARMVGVGVGVAFLVLCELVESRFGDFDLIEVTGVPGFILGVVGIITVVGGVALIAHAFGHPGRGSDRGDAIARPPQAVSRG